MKLDVEVYKDMTGRLAGIVGHLHSVRGRSVPGPVGGGVPRGNVWGYHDAEAEFGSVEDLNAWVNRRIAVIGKSVDFRSYPLVLCHLDMCRRNIILMEDGALCLLDWGFAGFLPRIYEVAAIEFYFDEYSEMFRQAVNESIVLEDREKKDLVLIKRARAASMRCAFTCARISRRYCFVLQLNLVEEVINPAVYLEQKEKRKEIKKINKSITYRYIYIYEYINKVRGKNGSK
ncbi:hypothetical protein I7I48_01224 [Histoplasma ohiense]|nr:hypothetical protein I7I48_01224 [Histoplasma ohiense (nom. inval.)]